MKGKLKFNIINKLNDKFYDKEKLPTVRELKEILDRFPDDWPIVWKIFEIENICSRAVGLGKPLTLDEEVIILNLLNNFKSLWIDDYFLNELIKKISGGELIE